MLHHPVADLYMLTWKDGEDMTFGEKKKTEESQSLLDFISVKIKYLFIIYKCREKGETLDWEATVKIKEETLAS